MIVSAEADS
jgi:sister-chromatid-cohesion protein PDS5